MEDRGIIISHPFTVASNYVQAHGNLLPEDLRQYLLYWDKIDLPQNNIIGIGEETVELSYLKQLGILEETKVNISGVNNFQNAILAMQSTVLKERNKINPGQWSLAQHGEFLNLSEDDSSEIETIEVELYNMIPVPIPAVHIDDILEFKERRKPELLNLRGVMDDLYTEIINSHDIPRSKIRAISKIEKSIGEINSVFNESWGSKLLSTLKIELNVQTITQAAAGAAIGSAFGVSAPIGAAIGAASSMVKFEIKATKKVNGIPEKFQDYAYLHYMTSELK